MPHKIKKYHSSYLHHLQVSLIVLHYLPCITKTSMPVQAPQHHYQQSNLLVFAHWNCGQTSKAASCR